MISANDLVLEFLFLICSIAFFKHHTALPAFQNYATNCNAQAGCG